MFAFPGFSANYTYEKMQEPQIKMSLLIIITLRHITLLGIHVNSSPGNNKGQEFGYVAEHGTRRLCRNKLGTSVCTMFGYVARHGTRMLYRKISYILRTVHNVIKF